MGQIVLSICIPTYNRAKFLDENLSRLKREISDLPIELLVSDNCSLDETESIVTNYISQGLVCNYYKNEENIGADRNFVNCFQKAKGKYIWLLGDDDYIEPNALKPLVDFLDKSEVGLLHIDNKGCSGFQMFDSVGKFFSEIGVLITFMSVNIIRRDIVDKVNHQDLIGSFLIQVGFYTISAASGYDNVIYHSRVLSTGADGANNGGYNYFEVFVRNLLKIYYLPVKEGMMEISEYEYVKKSIFKEFVSDYTIDLLILKKPSKLKIKGARGILFKNYGKNLYFYTILFNKIYNRLTSKLTKLWKS